MKMLKKQTGIKPRYIVEIVNDDMIKCQRYDNQTEYTYFERFAASKNLKKGDLLADGEFGKFILLKNKQKRNFFSHKH